MSLIDTLGGRLAPPPPAPALTIRSSRARRWREAARDLGRRPGFLLAFGWLALIGVAAVAPGLLAHQDPFATAPLAKMRPPGAEHWFGTDQIGRDLFARVVHGTRLSILAALLAVGIAAVGGSALGLAAGFLGRRVDAVIMRLIDVLLALPGLLLALTIVTAIGFGTFPVAVAVGFGLIPGFARTMRVEVARVRTLPYVEAARLGGVGRARALLAHVLPNAAGPVYVLATLDFGVAILVASGLSFLGFGAAPPAAEWGTLIANGRNFLVTAPWLSLIPGLVVASAVYALNHIARAFEEVSE